MNFQHFKFVGRKRNDPVREDGALNQSSFVMVIMIAKMDPTRSVVIQTMAPQLNVMMKSSTAHRQ